MSTPPPPPPRRARGPVDPTESQPGAPGPAPPPPRRPRPEGPPGPPTATVGATAVTASGPTRAQRRAAAAPPGKRSRGNGDGRRGLVITVAVIVVLALVVGGAFAAGVFGGGGGGGGPEPLEASNNVHLSAGKLTVRWPGEGPGASDPNLPNEVMKVIGRYVDDGIVPGLRTGAVKDQALGATFDDAALAALNDPNTRSSMLDEKLPKAIGELTITSKPIDMVALNDADNHTVLTSAKIRIKVLVQSEKGWYTVEHNGQLVIQPQLDGSWKITAWDAKASRTPPGPKPKPKPKNKAKQQTTTTKAT